MSFPVYLSLGPLSIHPHFFFELLAYTLGFQAYRWLSKRSPVQTPRAQQLWILMACIVGAALGARLLAWLETPYDPLTGQWMVPGKTIVGGLLGGWIGIELIKRRLGILVRTGDAYVLPLALGIAWGRIGCFLTGLSDHTYGMATALPWGVDFGDGVMRHPTQLYESLFLVLTALVLWCARDLLRHHGLMFRAFMGAYLSFRLGVECLKPSLKIYGGMSAIQWACVGGLIALLISLMRIFSAAIQPAATGPEPADNP